MVIWWHYRCGIGSGSSHNPTKSEGEGRKSSLGWRVSVTGCLSSYDSWINWQLVQNGAWPLPMMAGLHLRTASPHPRTTWHHPKTTWHHPMTACLHQIRAGLCSRTHHIFLTWIHVTALATIIAALVGTTTAVSHMVTCCAHSLKLFRLLNKCAQAVEGNMLTGCFERSKPPWIAVG